MKKGKMVLAAGVVILVLSACGQTESAEEKQSEERLIIERIDDVGEVQETETADPAESAGKCSRQPRKTMHRKRGKTAVRQRVRQMPEIHCMKLF